MSQNATDFLRDGTICLSHAGIAEGTNSATIKIAAPNGAGIDYAIKGQTYHKADTDNIAVTAHAVQAVSTSCLYLVQINSSGTVSTKKGTAVTTTDVTNGLTPLEWPQPDANNCAIGGYRIDTSASVTYTNGTTDNSDAGITDTYYSFAMVPAAPIAA